MLATRLNSLLCLLLNHVIKHESWAITRLRPFSGAYISIIGLPLAITLTIDEHGFFSIGQTSDHADVTLTLPDDALGRGLLSLEQLVSSIKISGSVDLAETLGFIFRNLRWDIESDLANYIGDIPAHRLSRIGANLYSQTTDGIQRLGLNLVEFAREDSSLLVANSELTQFGHNVDQLRDDLARLEQRIRRFQ